MFNTFNYYNNSEKIVKTKQNFSLLFNKFCYYYNKGMNLSEISKTIQLNWRTVKNMEKNYKLLDVINSLDVTKPIKSGIFVTLTEVNLFKYLTTDNNYFKKYNEVLKDNPGISRYYYKRVKQYITSQL